MYSGKKSESNTVSESVSAELETGGETVPDEEDKVPLGPAADLALVKSISVTLAHNFDMERFLSHDWAADIYPQSHRIVEPVCPSSVVQLWPLSSHPSDRCCIGARSQELRTLNKKMAKVQLMTDRRRRRRRSSFVIVMTMQVLERTN